MKKYGPSGLSDTANTDERKTPSEPLKFSYKRQRDPHVISLEGLIIPQDDAWVRPVLLANERWVKQVYHRQFS